MKYHFLHTTVLFHPPFISPSSLPTCLPSFLVQPSFHPSLVHSSISRSSIHPPILCCPIIHASFPLYFHCPSLIPSSSIHLPPLSSILSSLHPVSSIYLSILHPYILPSMILCIPPSLHLLSTHPPIYPSFYPFILVSPTQPVYTHPHIYPPISPSTCLASIHSPLSHSCHSFSFSPIHPHSDPSSPGCCCLLHQRNGMCLVPGSTTFSSR